MEEDKIIVIEKTLPKGNGNILETCCDIVILMIDLFTDIVAEYIKYKDLEKRLKL